MRKLSYLLIGLLVFVLTAPVFANPFADAPSNHWAYDAVQQLSAKGIVEGYPDGQYKGDRAATRYEMAMVVARVIAKLEQVQASIPPPVDLTPYAKKDEVQAWLANYATKEELAVLRKLLQEYKDELDKLGVRVTKIEEDLGKLEARVTELERVKFSGTLYGVGSYIKTKAIDPNWGFITFPFNNYASPSYNNAFDPLYFTGWNTRYSGYPTMGAVPFRQSYPLPDGAAITMRMDLTITAKISDTTTAGVLIQAYSAMGRPGVAHFWGAAPMFSKSALDNHYLYSVFAGPNMNPTLSNTLSDISAQISSFWLTYKRNDWYLKGTFGTFQISPEYTSYQIFLQPLNFSYFGPFLQDSYGAHFLLKKGTFFLEAAFSPDWLNSGKVAYNFNGGCGQTPFMWSYPGWPNHPNNGFYLFPTSDPVFTAIRSYMGLVSLGIAKRNEYQLNFSYVRFADKAWNSDWYPYTPDETRWGVRFSYVFNKDFTLLGEYNKSKLINMFDSLEITNGSFTKIGFIYKFKKGSRFMFTYVSVDQDYAPLGFYSAGEGPCWDKFVCPEISTGARLDYLFYNKDWRYMSAPISAFDYLYRRNRKGWEAVYDTPFAQNKGKAYFSWLNQTQIQPSAGVGWYNTNIMSPVWPVFAQNAAPTLDSIFPIPGGGDPTLGKFNMYSVRLSYQSNPNSLLFKAHWRNMSALREYDYIAYPGQNNYINQRISVAGLGIDYPVNPKFILHFNYDMVKTKGYYRPGTDLNEGNSTPNVDASFSIPSVGFTYLFAKKTRFWMGYSYYSYKDNLAIGGPFQTYGINDYKTHRISSELMVDF